MIDRNGGVQNLTVMSTCCDCCAVHCRLTVTCKAFKHPDTDFVVMLMDVFPDGRNMDIQNGTSRARYRNGRGKASV